MNFWNSLFILWLLIWSWWIFRICGYLVIFTNIKMALLLLVTIDEHQHCLFSFSPYLNMAQGWSKKLSTLHILLKCTPDSIFSYCDFYVCLCVYLAKEIIYICRYFLYRCSKYACNLFPLLLLYVNLYFWMLTYGNFHPEFQLYFPSFYHEWIFLPFWQVSFCATCFYFEMLNLW